MESITNKKALEKLMKLLGVLGLNVRDSAGARDIGFCEGMIVSSCEINDEDAAGIVRTFMERLTVESVDVSGASFGYTDGGNNGHR